MNNADSPDFSMYSSQFIYLHLTEKYCVQKNICYSKKYKYLLKKILNINQEINVICKYFFMEVNRVQKSRNVKL